MEEINHVDKRNFDRNMANIGPCNPKEEAFEPNKNALYFLILHPNGFQWDGEIMGDEKDVEGVPGVRSTGWADKDPSYD